MLFKNCKLKQFLEWFNHFNPEGILCQSCHINGCNKYSLIIVTKHNSEKLLLANNNENTRSTQAATYVLIHQQSKRHKKTLTCIWHYETPVSCTASAANC